MPLDNVTLPPSSIKAATREVTYSGELAHAQAVGLVTLEGPDDAKTARDISDANPLPIQETSTPTSLLNRILARLMSPLGYDRSIDRSRTTTVLESGTVTTVTGLTNIDGRNGSMLINQTNLSAWADCVRARIT
jgi:hypothetical protein